MRPEAGQVTASERQERRRRPPLVTRDQAVDAAYALILEEGPDGLSMRKLAGALGVSLPTVYAAIDRREALVADLQQRIIGEITVELGLESDKAPGPIHQLGQRLLAWAKSQPRLADFLLVEDLRGEVAVRATEAASPELRLNALRLANELLGSGPAELDPVAATALVIASTRAALWLATEAVGRTADGGGEAGPDWLDIGAAGLAAALRRLAEGAALRPA